MKQILQNLRNGETHLADVCAPSAQPGEILIRTRVSLVSQGTEKMLVQFGKASLLQKARSQPEKVKQVLAKIKTDGLVPTVEAVFRKLDEPIPLGYCNVGVIIAVGEGVTGFSVGDRVASNGPHAEIVSVPTNLCAKIPDEVSDDAAAFTVLGAIALQGIRLVKPELGETVVVIGLGLIGQITAQLLQAAGCRVIGFDFDRTKVEAASRLGVEAICSGGEFDPVRFVTNATSGLGADAVIITASTSSNEVISQSARMSRKRGRIVLVGVVGLAINRSDFYDKELSFQVSCSYGPGRYDDTYEEKGFDYPAAFVRWTENRNFQAVLEALRTGRLRVEPLITRRVALAQYLEIYGQMDGAGLASLLLYDCGLPVAERSPQSGDDSAAGRRFSGTRESATHPGQGSQPAIAAITAGSTIRVCNRTFNASEAPLAIIGAGNFTKMTVMPALQAANATVKTIASASGVSGTSLARKYAIPYSTTDFESVVTDPEVRGVIITTRHNLHAAQVIRALKNGKHVLVEKPLCLTAAELRQIEAVVRSAEPDTGTDSGAALRPTLTVGYNRRFSPHVEKIRALLGDDVGPVSIVATMNAGAIPLNHWVHDPEIGGGRILGEACHFLDLAIFLTRSPVVSVSAIPMAGAGDTASILLRHANGSTAVVNYFANGHRELSKERVEVHNGGRSLLIDNFRELRGYGFKSFSQLKTRQDKGHARQFSLFAERVQSGGPALIPWMEILNSTRATLAAACAIKERRWVGVDEIQ